GQRQRHGFRDRLLDHLHRGRSRVCLVGWLPPVAVPPRHQLELVCLPSFGASSGSRRGSECVKPGRLLHFFKGGGIDMTKMKQAMGLAVLLMGTALLVGCSGPPVEETKPPVPGGPPPP